jgi:hypothetical protein
MTRWVEKRVVKDGVSRPCVAKATLNDGGAPLTESENFLRKFSGGERGIRTPGTSFIQYGGLANRCLKPLGHLSS